MRARPSELLKELENALSSNDLSDALTEAIESTGKGETDSIANGGRA